MSAIKRPKFIDSFINRVKLVRLNRKILLTGAAVVGLILIASIAYSTANNYLRQSSRISDQDKAQDLYKIVRAIDDYHNEYEPKSFRLPPKLTAKFGKNLKGNVEDYKYKYASRGYQGVSYQICATFQAATLKFPVPYPGPVAGDPNEVYVYRRHREGLQCFQVSYAEGGPYVYVLLNKNEIGPHPPIPTSNNIDFDKLYAFAKTYYSTQAPILGIPYSESDLQRVCTKLEPNAPGKTAFGCSVVVLVSHHTTSSIAQARSQMTRFMALADKQGFLERENKETSGGLLEGDDSRPFQIYEGNQNPSAHSYCEVKVRYNVSDKVRYGLLCTADNSPVIPSNFREDKVPDPGFF